MRIELNPTTLFKYGIGLEDVRAALASANANSPKGAIEAEGLHYQIYTNDQATKAADYKPLVIAYRNGAAVHLSDVADVEDSVENIDNAGFSNGKPAVLVIVFRQPGANIIQTIDSVKAAIPELMAAMPRAMTLTIANDRSTTIRQSLNDTEMTLVIAVVLVTLVVFLFLRNLRATMIPAVAVPVSIIGTFGAMYLMGFSLDNLSLMALTVSTGFVVDDAIVVLENIIPSPRSRHATLAGRVDRRARGRVHRAVHEPVAGRGVPADPADGRHRRPAVPRVRHDAVAGNHGVAGDFPDDHADDVRAVPAAPPAAGGAAAAHLVRPRAVAVRADARMVAAPQPPGHPGADRDDTGEFRVCSSSSRKAFSRSRIPAA